MPALIPALFLTISGCDSQSPPMNQSTQGVEQSQGSSAQQSNPWPFLSEQDQNKIADNLLSSNIYIVFDGSGSMQQVACSGGEPKIRAAKRALLEFVKAVPASANLGMVAFDRNGTKERTPLGTVNFAVTTKSINAVSQGGGTPLSTAIDIAYQKLTAQAKKQLGYGDYHLVVVTDGEASNGYEPDKVLAKILAESPVIVHTIGFCIDTRHSLNQPGRTIYNTAQDYESLRRGLQSVLAEAPEFSVSEFN
ncbi:MAG: VWA domain-containing protein [Gammaproteobacteria bacterium]|nr:VWA domain-containing protein [Gammaproteobacteria bacterium]